MAPKVLKRPSASTSTDKTAAAKVKQKILKAPAALFQKGRVDKSVVKKATEMTREQFVKFQEGMDAKWPLPGYMNGEKGHCHFRDETYERITRWTAETRIAYRPHAKAPGSKSHLRYEKYSSAKTVGEALRVGSYPMDWCWDYERGFIKVLGGPMREEPLDVAKEDEGQVTDVDRTIANWYVRELAKMVGVKGSELTTGSGVGESTLERGRRLLAQREACERLEAADREGRRINDEDVLAILKRWPFAKNPYRKNVMQPGKTWVFSDSMGILRDRQGDVHLTACSRRYPQVVELFGRWLKDHLPDDAKGFTWTTINVNCNYAAVTHRDNGNFGPSFIKAFGEFEGGALDYWPDDTGGILEDLPKSKQSFDLTEGLALFNGNCAHGVQPFKGSRYSLVYFTLGCHPSIKHEDRERMKNIGFPLPATNEDPFKLLRPPKGYLKKAGATPTKKELPAYRCYEPAAIPNGRRKPKSAAEVKKIAKARLQPENARSFYNTEQRRAQREEDNMEF
mmetsp:Transcript_69094/g.182519  ORF Transcript_69094/g.182519 Transcript_69094/m.182519 type:complete len:509 (-) Transcript_69094:171-1697(-)